MSKDVAAILMVVSHAMLAKVALPVAVEQVRSGLRNRMKGARKFARSANRVESRKAFEARVKSLRNASARIRKLQRTYKSWQASEVQS